jgi:predicted membrane protein
MLIKIIKLSISLSLKYLKFLLVISVILNLLLVLAFVVLMPYLIKTGDELEKLKSSEVNENQEIWDFKKSDPAIFYPN